MKKVLITGISGFAGSFLAEYLLSCAYSVYGTYLSDRRLSNLIPIKDKIHLEQFDIQEKEKVDRLINSVKPDIIFHLAALSSPSESFKDPTRTFINNIVGQINILEAVLNSNIKNCRIIIVSSAEVYGQVSVQDLPIDEQTPLRPLSPYAVSKVTQDFLGLQYFLSSQLDVVRFRPFNHIGPRQTPHFVVSSFAKQIADIEKGTCEPVINVGNLDSSRDFTDVRDMVRAYSMIANKAWAGEVYNIGSGVSRKIGDILKILLSLTDKKIEIKTDQSRIRKNDIPDIVCDNSKIVKLTFWKPSIPFEQTLKDTLDYWRNIG